MALLTIQKILEILGLLFTLSALYTPYREYAQHSSVQADHQWLYNHCIENEKLRDVSDACDKVMLLFTRTPWQHALQPWQWLADMAKDNLCVAGWISLLLLLSPLYFAQWTYRTEKDLLLQQANQSATLRYRGVSKQRKYMV
jgi:hypothetical protein